MKKIAYILIGCLCTLVLTYSYYAFADQGAGTQSSQEMTGVLAETPGELGKLKFTNEAGPQELTLAKSAWVYRDQQKAVLTDLKVGDKLEVIVNNKKQAAFIKAYSAGSALPEKQNAAIPKASVSSNATIAPSASANGTVPVPSVIPPTPAGANGLLKPGATPSSAKTGEASDGGIWENVSVKANTVELNVEIKQGGGHSEVYILTKGHEKVIIRGASAEQLIHRLMEGISPQSPTVKQELTNRIIQEFNLTGKQADQQLEVKWMANEGVQQQEQDKGSNNKDKHEKEDKSRGEGKKKD